MSDSTTTTTTATLSDQIQSEIEEGVAHLKHVPPPEEKVVLPSADDIEAEKTEQALHASIEGFDSSALRHVTSAEKVVLPSAADIEAEKRLSSSGGAADAEA